MTSLNELYKAVVNADLERRLDAALHALSLMLEHYGATDRKTQSGLPIYDGYGAEAHEEACKVLQNEGRITNEQW